jgi:hypothetical protein
VTKEAKQGWQLQKIKVDTKQKKKFCADWRGAV